MAGVKGGLRVPKLSKRLTEAYEEIRRISHSGAPLESLTSQITLRMKDLLDVDLVALLVTDPVTFLGLDAYTLGFTDEDVRYFLSHIYLQNEHWSFLDMKANRESISLLSSYTRGKLETEARYTDFYRPYGIEYEVRTTLNTGDAYWGALCLMRGKESRDFTTSEQQVLSQLSHHIGDGMRSAILRRALEQDQGGSMTTIMVDKGDRMLFGSRQAEEILEAFASPDQTDRTVLPRPLISVLALRNRGSDPVAVPVEPRLTLPDQRGRWWTVTALEPGAGSHPDVAAMLVVSPATPEERFPRLMALYDLTPREREMVEWIAAGLSTKEIAGQLFVSEYTVQDHLKKIFGKLNVTSRRELMALLFRRVMPGNSPTTLLQRDPFKQPKPSA